MNISDVKVGQRVRVTAPDGGLFYSMFEGVVGTVTRVEAYEDRVWVRFPGDDDSPDYGRAKDLTLEQDVAPVASEGQVSAQPQTVKDKIEQIEALLAEIKATLY